MYTPIIEYIEDLKADLEGISGERKHRLQKLAAYIQLYKRKDKTANLLFICTHNSRRSHLCQVWAAVVAHYLGMAVETYSGGTEVTAFNLQAAAALERCGFEVEREGEGENPPYRVIFDDRSTPLICYSKAFDNDVNPRRNFAAVMTCSKADKACPVISGAEERVALPYRDPKHADGTGKEEATYDACCRKIASEMLFLMKEVVQSAEH